MTRLLGLATFVVFLAGCGATTTGARDAPAEDLVATTTSIGGSGTTADSSPSTAGTPTLLDETEPEPDPESDPDVVGEEAAAGEEATAGDEPSTWTIGGAEVWSRSVVEPLPRRATEVEFTGTLIDNGDGPMACLGGVLTSLPPQCGGPIVVGLDLRDGDHEGTEIVWADRTVAFTWPPIDDRVELIAEVAYEPPDPGDYPPSPQPEMPAACAGIGRWMDGQIIGEWAYANQDRTGVPFAVGPSRVGLQVVGDVEEIRAELRAVAEAAGDGGDVGEPCLVEVDYSLERLLAAQKRLGGKVGWEAGITGSGAGNAENRLNVSVVVADVATVERVIELAADDPAMLRINGSTVILAGEG